MNAREKLRRLVEDLAELAERERGPLMPSIKADVGVWFQAAVAAYLAGKQPSMDHALGLVRGRGKPRATTPKGRNYERAREIFFLRLPHKKPSWLELAEKFDADPRDLQRDLKRYEADIIAEFVKANAG